MSCEDGRIAAFDMTHATAGILASVPDIFDMMIVRASLIDVKKLTPSHHSGARMHLVAARITLEVFVSHGTTPVFCVLLSVGNDSQCLKATTTNEAEPALVPRCSWHEYLSYLF